MKTTIKYIGYLGLVLALCAAVIFGCRCSTSIRTSDPLAGFHASSLGNLDSNKAITDDCNNYIKTLTPEEQKYLGPSPIDFYEDGTGRHAVEISIGLNGANWHHVLIYDKDNKRIKTIKYISGHYAS